MELINKFIVYEIESGLTVCNIKESIHLEKIDIHHPGFIQFSRKGMNIVARPNYREDTSFGLESKSYHIFYNGVLHGESVEYSYNYNINDYSIIKNNYVLGKLESMSICDYKTGRLLYKKEFLI